LLILGRERQVPLIEARKILPAIESPVMAGLGFP
jgi:hypothetical protein